MTPEPATATPAWLAHRMLDLAEFQPGAEHVFDPCAGTGGILLAAKERGAASTEFVELNAQRAAGLHALGLRGRRGSMDLLGPRGPCTLLAMNPDFRGGKWVSMLAWALANAPPRLVCVVPADWFGQLERARQQPQPGADEVTLALQAAYGYAVHNITAAAFHVQGRAVPTAVLYVRRVQPLSWGG